MWMSKQALSKHKIHFWWISWKPMRTHSTRSPSGCRLWNSSKILACMIIPLRLKQISLKVNVSRASSPSASALCTQEKRSSKNRLQIVWVRCLPATQTWTKLICWVIWICKWTWPHNLRLVSHLIKWASSSRSSGRRWPCSSWDTSVKTYLEWHQKMSNLSRLSLAKA